MANWRQTYLTFSGRIPRRTYWIGGILLLLISFAALLVLSILALVLGIALDALFGEATGRTIAGVIAVVPFFAVYAGQFIGFLALYVKRLHDRGKSAWWLLYYSLLPGVPQLVVLARAGFQPTAEVTLNNPLDLVLLVLSGVASLWILIDLGFLRGTRGPNRFGPDPLEPVGTDLPAGSVAA